MMKLNWPKTLAMCCLVAGFQSAVVAQGLTPYSFKSEKLLTATEVKNQGQTGTCWAFSCASFLESEVQRLNGPAADLSEMYVVRHIYRQKCENYVRRQGNAQFGEGGLAHDLINAIRQYGIVPESEYPGRQDLSKPHNHAKLEQTLKSKCKELVEQGQKGKLPADWLKEIDTILDDAFGKVPTKFAVGDRQFTPIVYRDFLGIRPDDYVTITSFTHHPFYEAFVLEIPDNFSNGQMYNLPLDELMFSLTHALKQGYSVEWDADVSNEGFSAQNGLAIVPQQPLASKTEAQREATFKFFEPQTKVTQAYRQQLFDQQVTMDDHLMHITGLEVETNSNEPYYRVKNSWGEISSLKGYLRVSDSYMRLNTISFMVHKNALPKEIAEKLGLASEGQTSGKPEPALKTTQPAKVNKIRPVKQQKVIGKAPKSEY